MRIPYGLGVPNALGIPYALGILDASGVPYASGRWEVGGGRRWRRLYNNMSPTQDVGNSTSLKQGMRTPLANAKPQANVQNSGNILDSYSILRRF